ncbi:MAG: glucokinase [Solirubrobacteraceae bacterium]|nr:glucokinase [Solirubrobacteraceae bacterium]
MSFLGLDVGGTKISAAVLEDGVLSEPVLHPTRTDSAEALVDQLAEIAQALRTPETEAVGLGIPSAIDFATGTAKSGVNVPLQGVPLRQLLGERLGLPVFVDNDANVAALAEAHEGGKLVARNLVMFTVGTGVGGGLVLDGRLFRGATGAGAEMGHILIGLDLAKGAPPPADHFPQPGSLEALASGSALDELAQAAAAANPDGALGRIAAGGEEVTGVEVVRLAKEGDAESVDLLRVLGGRLGIGIASAINLFDPEEVVVGGGVATAGELLLDPARRAAEGYVLTGVGELAQIRLARHGVRAGVYGATLLAAQEAGRSDQ